MTPLLKYILTFLCPQVFLFILVNSLRILSPDIPILSFSFWRTVSTSLLFPLSYKDPNLEEIWAEAGCLLTPLFMETHARVAPLTALSMAQGSTHETQNSHATCQYSLENTLFFFFLPKNKAGSLCF